MTFISFGLADWDCETGEQYWTERDAFCFFLYIQFFFSKKWKLKTETTNVESVNESEFIDHSKDFETIVTEVPVMSIIGKFHAFWRTTNQSGPTIANCRRWLKKILQKPNALVEIPYILGQDDRICFLS